MKLSSENLVELSQCAITAALAAGEVISSYADKSIEVQEKEGGDSLASQVVTEVDVLSEKAIVNILQPTCVQYDLALLTEETVDDRARLQKDYFWCVDPMDGTLSFIEGKPGFAVSIALVSRSGEALIGAVHDPSTSTLYCAVAGHGVSRNGEPWKVGHQQVTGQTLTLVCDRGFTDKSYYNQVCQALDVKASEQGYSGISTLEKNGAVLNACYVLENPPAVYFKCPKPEEGGGSLWDFAATAAIFSELGFVASDFHGKPLDLNRADSTFMNHRGVMYSMDRHLAREIQELARFCH